MKTILYNPIFINPQAYYVFPRLTRYLQPDNESTSEPANYIGTIEVKVIAYGDTTLKRTYTNTDSIDLSEFKNTWIRISLFTKVGSCVLGEWKIGNMESDLPYIDPEVLASLKAVVIVGNKTNNDSDRAIVKNLVDPDNPFVISNAAYTEGSGYADKGSPYYGAFVTDGINDLIKSTKSATEMLDGSNEVTVVSMIHQIKTNSDVTRNNWFFTPVSYLENRVVENKTGKTGIYGYTSTNVTNAQISDITPILGDKNDYTLYSKIEDGDRDYFTVEGFQNQGIWYVSSIAWYWTIIANKVLTTDQINQVIAYFNLDRTLKPDILCDVKKQGITNENHAEFGDKLIDFSGNGRDIQLNNIAWKGNSGIGKYNFSNINIIANRFEGTVTTNKCHFTKKLINTTSNFCDLNVISPNEPIKFKVSGLSDGRKLFVANKSGSGSNYNFDNGEHEVSLSFKEGDLQNNPFGVTGDIGDIDVTVEFIPSHAGALCLDGVNDFGKVTGLPIYKDYTVVADRELFNAIGCVLSNDNPGAFIFETSSASVYSFGEATTSLTIPTDKQIRYQTKYSYNGQNISIGAVKEGTSNMWLGTIRDNDARFRSAAIYSLMTFPYSMSEFLIERQLKKHKLGTLYPDMVEFRPVIKHDDRITAIKYYHIKGSSWIDLKPGDYISVGSKISITTNLKSPYTIANVMSSSLTDIKVVPSAGGGNAYDILGYVTDKSPQKITMDIQVDSSFVQWNPIVESNVPYKSVKYYKLVDTSWKAINVGDYVLVGQRILTQITTVGIEDEVVAAVSEQLDIYGINKNSNGEYNILGITSSTTPQNINITIDEYIRYEDIVQPYPSLFTLIDYDTEEVYSWGSKLKIGTKFKGNVINLLPDMYEWQGDVLYNGEPIYWNTTPGVVAKEMVFSWNMPFKYLIDNNEPKVILSPRLLRIPNNSYKILGYIPDISGHGNHGKINNSAYAGASGANGYLQNFSGWTKASGVSSTDSVISSSNNLVAANGWIAYVTSGTVVPTFKVEISGIPINGNLRFEGSGQTLVNGVNTIQGLTTTKISGFYISSGYDNDWSNLRIEQVGEYEGAYCLDGVDDFVTIPTVTGGKQVLMKVNWQSDVGAVTLYDQRLNISDYEFAIYNGTRDLDDNPVMAYQGRNNGQTYIDGILNSNIMASELKAITHNITITNELSAGVNKFSPVIGSNRVHNAYFTNMALYDFMLFDNISTDDKIKQLNEYVGIEGNTEWRKTK